MAELKPCPFCGADDCGVACMPTRLGWFAVQCSCCEASGPWRLEPADAEWEWNRRATAGVQGDGK